MKIGFDIRAASEHIGSGIGNYAYLIIRELLKEDKKNIYHFYNPNLKDYREVIKSNKNYTIKTGRSDSFWKDMYNTNWKGKPIAVDIYHNMINGIGLPEKGFKKLFITVHDLIPYIYPETCDAPHLDYVLKHTPYVLEKADKIFTVSEHSKKDIMRYFNIEKEKIVVTYLGANKIYKEMDKKEAKEEVKRKYNIDGNFIMYVGGFSSRKNIKSILYAYEKIKDKLGKSYKILILGKASRSYEELNEIAKRIKISDDVIFPGFIPDEDMPYFYNASTLFVYPSLYEGFGIPLLEAMGCGVPIITSSVSSIPEVVGDNAVLIDPNNIDEFSDKMQKVLEDDSLKEDLRKKGLERVKKFSWNKTALEILNEYMK